MRSWLNHSWRCGAMLAAGVAVALLTVPTGRAQGAATQAASQPATSQAAAAKDARPRLAVAGFTSAEGSDPRDAWMPTGVEEVLSWRLRRVPGLVVVPTVRQHQARRELQDDAELPPWPRVLAALGVQRMLTGRCEGPPDAVRLRLALTDVNGLGATAAPAAEITLPPARLFENLDTATQWVLEKLGVGPLSSELKRLIMGPPARSPSALEYYSRSVMAARADKFSDAGYYALQAIDYDDRFRMTLGLLAQLELQQGSNGLVAAGARLRAMSDLAQFSNDPVDRAAAELGLGVLLQLAGEFQAAYIRFETSLGISYEQDSPYGQLAAVNSLGDLYLTRTPPPGAQPTEEERKRFDHASLERSAEWQEVGLGILQKLGDAIGEAPAANKLALTYEKLGESERALAMHKRSLAAAERAGSRRNQATAWLYIGQWYQREKRWAEATDATQKCLALAAEGMKPVAWLTLASIYEGQDDAAHALEQFEQAYAVIRTGKDLTSQLLCARHIAELRMKLGQREKALAALQDAIDLAHATGSAEEAALRDKLTQWKSQGP